MRTPTGIVGCMTASMLAQITPQLPEIALESAEIRIYSYSWLVLSTGVKTYSFDGKSTAVSEPAIVLISSQSFFASASEPVMTRFIFSPLRAWMRCALCIWESPVTETGDIFLLIASRMLLYPESSEKILLNIFILTLSLY